jgi:hypothetical protein
MLNTHITVRDLSELRRMVGEQALSCIHAPRGLLPHHFSTPTFGIVPGADDGALVSARSLVGHYLQAYDWDSMFFAEAVGRLLGIKWLLLGSVKNFLAHQHEDGFVPRTISPSQVWDKGDVCKPFMCQMLYPAMERGDLTVDDVAPLLAPIERLLTYYRRHRFHEGSQLYHWRNALECGVDGNPALLAPREAHQSENLAGNPVVSYPDGRLLATDLNAYIYAELLAFSRICALCGADRRARKYAALAAELQEKIENTLWCDEIGMYTNVDPITGERVMMRSWTGLAPTLFGVSTERHARRVITENILSEEHFFRPCGIASLAASELLYNQALRAMYGQAVVCNWSGPMWILPSVLVAMLLATFDEYIAHARNLARRVLRPVLKDLSRNRITHENYNSETGDPLWAPAFMSWNVRVLDLASLIESDPSFTEATPELVTA